MLFVCWLWRGRGFDREVVRYHRGHVEVLRNMLRRHGGHDLVCVTDDLDNVPDGVTGVILPRDVAALAAYYPKLWAFSPEFHSIIGERFVSIDLDVIIAGDLAPVVAGDDDFLVWSKAAGEPYNTSLFALKPGCRTQVWANFSGRAAVTASLTIRRWTGDQSWVAHVLGPREKTFGEETGVIQYRPHHRAQKPAGLRAAFACGPYDPITEQTLSPWVAQEYQ
jgi:hypothetical protein